jgi:pimeloyl-ACP methyl ester carboxylesterase
MSDGTSMHSIVSGEGRRIVFVHGVGASLESWDGVVAALGAGYCSLRYDLRGHGRSPKTPGPYSLDLFERDLAALVAATGWESFHVVGFSLGGLIVQAFALRHPSVVQSLTIISSVAGRTEEERVRVIERARVLLNDGATAHMQNSVARWFTDEFRAAHPEVVRQRVERSLQNDPKTYAAAYQVLAESDLSEELPSIRMPTLVMTGEQDTGSTPRMARLMAALIPDARLHIFPKLKHSVLLEAPDQVALQLDAFIKESETS